MVFYSSSNSYTTLCKQTMKIQENRAQLLAACKQPINAPYFESEKKLQFYNPEAWSGSAEFDFVSLKTTGWYTARVECQPPSVRQQNAKRHLNGVTLVGRW